MKTWEMIKSLTDNRDAKFKCTNGCIVNPNRDFVIGCNEEGYIKFFEHGEFRDAFFDIHNKLDWEWELVPQEVTWQEAVQAWINGKNVYFILDGIRHDVNDRRFLRAIDVEGQDYPTCKRIFVIGKWYTLP